MDESQVRYMASALAARGVSLDAGLSDSELRHIEATLAFTFPPDLGALLRHALPTSESFPLWRQRDLQDVKLRLLGPADGICFDIEHNAFWEAAWGPKPSTLSDALSVARSKVAAAPVLVPIYSHRYIPASPCEEGNPVYSVSQTDIIYYGFDLVDYLCTEFRLQRPPGYRRPTQPKQIPFWDHLVSGWA